MNGTTDWFDVDRVADGWLQLTEGNPVLPCHSLVVEDGDDCVLVDTGLGIGDLPGMVRELTGHDDPTVLLTHSHWDHIGAAPEFADVSIHADEQTADGSVAIDVLSDEFGQRPGQFIQSCIDQGVEFPDGFDPDGYSIDPTDGVGTLEPWEEISVGDRTLELVPIPGHSPGQLAVLDRTAGICHGADVLEPGGEIFAQFQDSDVDVYRETMARLVDLRDEGAFDTLTTGHGDPLHGDELSVLDEVQDALDSVASGEIPAETVETNYGPKLQYEVGDVVVLTKTETST
ncbi:MBL fold metallo-hydrolase [Haloferax sp. YSMS24]|uniref:MBL fold metallo-hydrolase n=1 Tax=Haloferax sp. YSMS24 TaxID=3388425 RepID=UPI00398CEE30